MKFFLNSLVYYEQNQLLRPWEGFDVTKFQKGEHLLSKGGKIQENSLEMSINLFKKILDNKIMELINSKKVDTNWKLLVDVNTLNQWEIKSLQEYHYMKFIIETLNKDPNSSVLKWSDVKDIMNWLKSELDWVWWEKSKAIYNWNIDEWIAINITIKIGWENKKIEYIKKSMEAIPPSPADNILKDIQNMSNPNQLQSPRQIKQY